MSEYLRLYRQQGWYFFTVVTYNREKILIQPDNLIRLRQLFSYVMKKLPFKIDVVVILPDHIHCIWRLPLDDDDFSTRWRLIKRYFSIGINTSLTKRAEKKVWQRRFWEHLLRNEKDWRTHIDYIHYNPVKIDICKSFQPALYKKEHFYFDDFLIDWYLFHQEKEKLNEPLTRFKENPVKSIDSMLLILKILLFYGHTDLAVRLAEKPLNQ